MNGVCVDVPRLTALLADRLRLVRLDLTPLAVRCAWPVFKAVSPGVAPMFVKVTGVEAAARALAFLKGISSCPFLPRPVLPELEDFGGLAVLCLEWKEARQVNAEDMTEAQLDSFLDGCRTLAKALASYRGPVSDLAEEDSPRGEYNALQRYSLRHPFAGWFLKPLMSIPEAERSYGRRPLVAIHGDLQPKNYGFDGDRFAAVYDTDDLTRGLACEDAAYAFTERMRRLELTADARVRLVGLFRRLVGGSPWPKEDWLVAVNHARLRIAARRLEKHPDSPFVALDIIRRDRPLRQLREALEAP